jgi:hypothetical protein
LYAGLRSSRGSAHQERIAHGDGSTYSSSRRCGISFYTSARPTLDCGTESSSYSLNYAPIVLCLMGGDSRPTKIPRLPQANPLERLCSAAVIGRLYYSSRVSLVQKREISEMKHNSASTTITVHFGYLTTSLCLWCRRPCCVQAL